MELNMDKGSDILQYVWLCLSWIRSRMDEEKFSEKDIEDSIVSNYNQLLFSRCLKLSFDVLIFSIKNSWKLFDMTCCLCY